MNDNIDNIECTDNPAGGAPETTAGTDAIRAALIEGETGGEPLPFGAGAFKLRTRAQRD